MAEYLDCGTDVEKFMRAANAWEPAVLAVEKAESIYRLAADGHGLLIQHLFDMSASEPAKLRSFLEDKWLASRYEKGALPRGLMGSLSLGIETAWGELKDRMMRIAARVSPRSRALSGDLEEIPRERILGLWRRHPGLGRIPTRVLEGAKAVKGLVRAADAAGYTIIRLRLHGPAGPASALIGADARTPELSRLLGELRASGIGGRVAPWKQLVESRPGGPWKGGAPPGVEDAWLVPRRMPGMPTARYTRLVREAAWSRSGRDGQPMIVLAEDDPDCLQLLSMILEKDGYDVRTATNGREALELCRSLEPDLALLNFQMPIMDGIRACAELRADPASIGLKIIVYSASPVAEWALQAGADRFLASPMDLRRLNEAVAESLAVFV